MLEHLLLVAAIVQATTLVRLLRREDSVGRGYVLVVGLVLGLGLLAYVRADRFLAVVTVALSTLTVVVPWMLETASRAAFSRGHLGWVARMSSLRAILMPGSGLARQQRIVEGLAILESEGVDAALDHFRDLADQSEDGGELAIIHEQIVSMLFYGQRWEEGIAHYERRFHPGYAALRPSLALGLLRAYGESGRMQTAAGLLRALEEGPYGEDPRAAELLSQARLTFLAYAGVTRAVDRIVTEDRHADLGLTRATVVLFHGIALARAGEERRAAAALRSVERIAGPKDRRVLEASRTTLDRSGDLELDLEPELRGYAQAVAERLHRFLTSTPHVRRTGSVRVTYGLIVSMGVLFGVAALRGSGAAGLLRLGAAAPGLVEGVDAFRAFSSVWLHADTIGLLFDAYAIWLSGQVVERVLGSGRMGLASVGAAGVGTLAAVFLTPAAEPALAAGGLAAIGAVVAALWTLLPMRTPNLSARSRRNLTITLVLLLLAELLITLPGGAGLGVAPLALAITALVSTAAALAVPVGVSRGVRMGLLGLFGVVAGLGIAGVVVGATSDPVDRRVQMMSPRCEVGGFVVPAAPSFRVELERIDAGLDLPLFVGLVDGLELRAANVVQVLAVPGHHPDLETALFAVEPGLADEIGVTALESMPEALAEAAAEEPEQWRSVALRRNGELVGAAVERRVEGATLLLVASPAEALGHQAPVYARSLTMAAPADSAAQGSQTPRCDP